MNFVSESLKADRGRRNCLLPFMFTTKGHEEKFLNDEWCKRSTSQIQNPRVKMQAKIEETPFPI